MDDKQLEGHQDLQEVRDSRGRRLFDDEGQPIHWATPAERVIAFVLALVVIAITVAFAYSLSTGDLIRR